MARHSRYRRPRYHSNGQSLSTPVILFLAIGSVIWALWSSYQYTLQPVYLWAFITLLFVTVVGGALTLWWLIKRRARQQLLNLALTDIDQMSGVEFENYVAELLRFKGFTQVDVTPVGADFGVDIVARRDNLKYAVQVKRYKGLVGVDALYQVMGGKAYYECDRTMVVTNSTFSPAAWELTTKAKVWLIDRSTLTEWMIEFNPALSANRQS